MMSLEVWALKKKMHMFIWTVGPNVDNKNAHSVWSCPACSSGHGLKWIFTKQLSALNGDSHKSIQATLFKQNQLYFFCPHDPHSFKHTHAT